MILNPLFKAAFSKIIPNLSGFETQLPPSMEYKAIYTDRSKSAVFSEQRDIGISHILPIHCNILQEEITAIRSPAITDKSNRIITDITGAKLNVYNSPTRRQHIKDLMQAEVINRWVTESTISDTRKIQPLTNRQTEKSTIKKHLWYHPVSLSFSNTCQENKYTINLLLQKLQR